MYLALVLTTRCNAACVHCSTSCGPERTEALPKSRVLSLMDEAAESSRQTGDEWLHFSFTGGEPFLDFPLLLDAVAHAHRLGADVSCVSNAYWASSDERARSMLTQLHEAGLGLLAVSTSRFHEAFVKRTRVERALRIASGIGLRTQLKVVQTASDEADGETATRAWATGLGVDKIQFIPLAPALRAGAYLPDQAYPHRDLIPAERCPASLISIDPTGAAHACCTPGASGPFYSLGNAHDHSLREIRDRFHFSGKQQILREHGPAFFADRIRKEGYGGRLRASYGDVCQMCTHIAHDPVMAKIAEAASQAFELEQVRSIVTRAAAGPHELPGPSTTIREVSGEL